VTIESDDPNEQLKSGKFPTRIRTSIDGTDADIWAPMGSGMGGSSLLYAAALQRLHKSDFDHREGPNGLTLEWPYSYKDLEPYYQKAESVFHVCGTPDPTETDTNAQLRPPPAMCEQDRIMFQDFTNVGLNPYRLHVGAKYVKDCGECGGYICNKNCKQDAYNACIVPALKYENFYLSDYTEALKLHTSDKKITAVEVKKDGQTHKLKARCFVLSSGAYFTPLLLLKSQSDTFPNGVANSSGLVGKNLMFHANDYLAVWPSRKGSREGNRKTLAVRDFYLKDGKKYAEIQSTGLGADYGLVLFALYQIFDASKLRKLKLLKHFLRIPAKIASILYGSASVLSVIIEDYPYPENRVTEDKDSPSGMRFEYTIHSELKSRVYETRKILKHAFKGIRMFNMQPNVGLNYGHPCGTMKAGHNPETSVINADCRAHDVDNLYVADSSFMPTSGATNPSLTIAANAFKVSDAIKKALAESN
jgi:choline dehydrogenase-like flavoprotein